MTQPLPRRDRRAVRHRTLVRRRLRTADRLELPHRVLVVAAHAWQRDEILRDLGMTCEVMSAPSYAAALRILREPHLACSIVARLDLGSGHDGVDLMTAARTLCPLAVHVLITDPPRTHAAAQRFIRARRADQLILTPWREGEIRAAVHAACTSC